MTELKQHLGTGGGGAYHIYIYLCTYSRPKDGDGIHMDITKTFGWDPPRRDPQNWGGGFPLVFPLVSTPKRVCFSLKATFFAKDGHHGAEQNGIFSPLGTPSAS